MATVEDRLSSDAGEPKRYGPTAARGLITTSLSQAVKIAVNFALTITAARLIAPSEYGVVAMAAPITGFILIFQNLGLNQAVVQVKDLPPAHINALFWYNMIASVAIAAIMLAIAPAVSWFYGDPRAAYYTAAMSLTVLVTGLSLQHSALLNREMRFTALALIDIFTSISLLIFTIAFAFAWHSYWSLWAGTFASMAINSLLMWRAMAWRPSRAVEFRGTRKVLTFGANVTGFSLLNFASRNSDNVLVAKAWGAIAVGLYDRSYKLMMFPIQNLNQPLARVMLPILARLNGEPVRYRQSFLFAIRLISLVSVPGVLAAAICSESLIPMLLGDRWSAASPIFFWLSLAAVTQPVSNAAGWLFLSTDRPAAMFKWSLYSTPVVVLSFLIGLPWGAKGVAEAYFIGQIVRVPVLYVWATRTTAVRARDLYGAMLPTLIGGAAAWLLIIAINPASPLVKFLTAVVASYSFSLLAQASSREGRETLHRTIGLLRSLRS